MTISKKILKSKLIHSNPFSKINLFKVKFNSFYKNYYVTYFGPRVGIVVVDNNNILLVKQYRFLIDNYSLEIPGGGVENAETPLEAIKRELYEETGIKCIDADEIVSYYPGLDNVDNKTTVYLCKNYSNINQFTSNEREAIDIVWMPIEEIVYEIKTGKQLDALTIIGVMTYYASLKNDDNMPNGQI